MVSSVLKYFAITLIADCLVISAISISTPIVCFFMFSICLSVFFIAVLLRFLYVYINSKTIIYPVIIQDISTINTHIFLKNTCYFLLLEIQILRLFQHGKHKVCTCFESVDILLFFYKGRKRNLLIHIFVIQFPLV